MKEFINCTHTDGPPLTDKYANAWPFAHIILEELIETKLAIKAYETFPDPSDEFWTIYDNPLERKLMYSNFEGLPIAIQTIITQLNSKEFITFLEKLTGFKNIMADPELIGGGLHQIERGGKLDIHADFNIHYNTGHKRCLNLILFLNKDWKEEYGGHLELWDRRMNNCEQQITPMFNRAVIFSTDDTSFHGHPKPLRCPQTTTRKSIALYYYIANTNEAKSHSTRYQQHPQDSDDAELAEFRKLRSRPKKERDK